MDIGCGVDIIEINRIKNDIESIGDRFLNRVFTDREIEYCESKKAQKFQHYAGRFAAKEAIMKALSDTKKYSFIDFEILTNPDGSPYCANNSNIKISIAHENKFTIAFVTANQEIKSDK